jgi:hypothetical protein
MTAAHPAAMSFSSARLVAMSLSPRISQANTSRFPAYDFF